MADQGAATQGAAMAEHTDAAGNRDIADRVGDVGRSRWWLVAYGVLTLIAGILVVVWPGATLLVIAVVFALQLFVLGIFRVVAAFAEDTSSGNRVLSVIIGVLSFIVGILCLRAPLQTVVVLALILGAFWLVNGVMEIVHGIGARGEPGRGWTIASGVIGVIGGIVVLSAPVVSAVALAWFMGILLIVLGIVAIVSGFSRSHSLADVPSSGGSTASPAVS